MKLEYLLLSLIRINPEVSGYQLKTIITKSSGYFIPVHLSQIYPTLKKMSTSGWVTYRVEEQVGKPSLKLYTITEDGKAVLDAWLVEPFEFTMTRANLDQFFIKLLCMGHVGNEEICAYIDTGIEQLRKAHAEWGNSDLAVEKAFLSVPEKGVREKYLTLWESEHDYMIDDLDLRIKQLENLKERLQ